MSDQLTRVLSLALRHKPEAFGIEVDSQGWASLPSIADGINRQSHGIAVTENSLREFVAEQLLERFEVQGDRIRALYGHSLLHVAVGEMNNPPETLFHATRAILLPRIRKNGLTAQGRNGVHFTARWDYALSVKDGHTNVAQRGVILAIRAADTAYKGIPFYQATNHIWLSPYIPSRFLWLVPSQNRTCPEDAPRTFIPLDSEENRAILREQLKGLSHDDDDSKTLS